MPRILRNLSNKKCILQGETIQKEWSIDELKKCMAYFGVTEQDVADDLWIPVQRIKAALKPGKWEGTDSHHNPHVYSTRTLIGIYLMSGFWAGRRERDLVLVKAKNEKQVAELNRMCRYAKKMLETYREAVHKKEE